MSSEHSLKFSESYVIFPMSYCNLLTYYHQVNFRVDSGKYLLFSYETAFLLLEDVGVKNISVVSVSAKINSISLCNGVREDQVQLVNVY